MSTSEETPSNQNANHRRRKSSSSSSSDEGALNPLERKKQKQSKKRGKKLGKASKLFGALATGLSLGMTYQALQRLPANADIPIHYNHWGEPDWTMNGKNWLWLYPALTAAVPCVIRHKKKHLNLPFATKTNKKKQKLLTRKYLSCLAIELSALFVYLTAVITTDNKAKLHKPAVPIILTALFGTFGGYVYAARKE